MNTYIRIVKRIFNADNDYYTLKEIEIFRYTSKNACEEKLWGYTELRRYRDPFNSSIIVVVVE